MLQVGHTLVGGYTVVGGHNDLIHQWLHCFKIVTQLQLLRYHITSGKRLCQASGIVEHSVPVPIPVPVPVPGPVFLQAHILATQSSTAGASCCRIFLAWGRNGEDLLQVAAGTRCWQDPKICIKLLGTAAVARNRKHRIISRRDLVRIFYAVLNNY